MRRVTVTQLVDFSKCEKLGVLKLTQKEAVNAARGRAIDAGVAAHGRLERQAVVDGRCFVASYAFGCDAPETNALRSHRDRSWLGTAPGRLGAAAYYRLSPPAVGLLRRMPGGRALARFLVRIYIRAVLGTAP